MTLQTLFNNIIVTIIEDQSDIIISEDVVKVEKGLVKAVGSGNNSYDMELEEGMIVYFNKRDAIELKHNEEKYYVLSQLDVIAYENE